MTSLQDQYVQEVREYLASLDNAALTALDNVFERLTEIQYEYDLNNDEEIKQAIDTASVPPYPDPGSWLSLDEFSRMVFEVAGDAGIGLSK